MDYSTSVRILVVCVFLLISEIRGQLDEDSMKICKLCYKEDLLDCNLTDTIHINMTANCDICTLRIEDQSFEGFENISIEQINPKAVCRLRDNSEVSETHLNTVDSSTSAISTTSEWLEIFKTIATGPLVEVHLTTHDSVNYEEDEPDENTRTSHAETINCFTCNSSSDEACLSNTENLKTIGCSMSSGCMTVYSNGNVMRNCASSENAALCNKPGQTNCERCPDSLCNRKPWKQCYQCDSKTNPSCARWSNGETIPKSACSNNSDNCLSRITSDGDTVRECTHSVFKCPPGELCSICDESLCNGGVFPENRRQCIQCNECEDGQDTRNALPCARYSINDQCSMFVTANSKMIRGCLSDNDVKQQCQMEASKCITCVDQNGCNSAPLMKDASLSCNKCNSKDNPSCASVQPPTAVAKCQKKVHFYLQETCMTEFDPAKQAAVRDCSFDYGACTTADPNCRTCSGNGCNNWSLKEPQCIQCSSANPGQNKCASQADGIPPTKCPKQAKQGCYAMRKGNITSRGCIATLTDDEMKICKMDENETVCCKLCMLDGCNNQPIGSSAWRTWQISLLTTIICLLTTT